VTELPFVKTLLRSVPLAWSRLDRDVNAELSLDRSKPSPWLLSDDPFGVECGNGNPFVGSIGRRSWK
jgi:hypothetical protein